MILHARYLFEILYIISLQQNTGRVYRVSHRYTKNNVVYIIRYHINYLRHTLRITKYDGGSSHQFRDITCKTMHMLNQKYYNSSSSQTRNFKMLLLIIMLYWCYFEKYVTSRLFRPNMNNCDKDEYEWPLILWIHIQN